MLSAIHRYSAFAQSQLERVVTFTHARKHTSLKTMWLVQSASQESRYLSYSFARNPYRNALQVLAGWLTSISCMILPYVCKFLIQILHSARKVATIVQDQWNHCKFLASFSCKNLALKQDNNLAWCYALELVQESCKIRIACTHPLVVMTNMKLITMTKIQILWLYIACNVTTWTCTSTTQ